MDAAEAKAEVEVEAKDRRMAVAAEEAAGDTSGSSTATSSGSDEDDDYFVGGGGGKKKRPSTIYVSKSCIAFYSRMQTSVLKSIWSLVHSHFCRLLAQLIFADVLKHVMALIGEYLAAVRSQLLQLERCGSAAADAGAATASAKVKVRRSSFMAQDVLAAVDASVMTAAESKEETEDEAEDVSEATSVVFQEVVWLCNFYYVTVDLVPRVRMQLTQLFPRLNESRSAKNEWDRMSRHQLDLFKRLLVQRFCIRHGARLAKCLFKGHSDGGSDEFDFSQVSISKGTLESVEEARMIRAWLEQYLPRDRVSRLLMRQLNLTLVKGLRNKLRVDAADASKSKAMSSSRKYQLAIDAHFYCAAVMEGSATVMEHDSVIQAKKEFVQELFAGDRVASEVDFEAIAMRLLEASRS